MNRSVCVINSLLFPQLWRRSSPVPQAWLRPTKASVEGNKSCLVIRPCHLPCINDNDYAQQTVTHHGLMLF